MTIGNLLVTPNFLDHRLRKGRPNLPPPSLVSPPVVILTFITQMGDVSADFLPPIPIAKSICESSLDSLQGKTCKMMTLTPFRGSRFYAIW